MKKRCMAALCAALTLCTTLTTVTIPHSVSAANAYNVDVSVDLTVDGTPISPYIYGVNDHEYLDKANWTCVRQGGNRYSSYNWETNASNAGADWKHYSDNYLVARYDSELAKTPGACPIHLSQDAAENDVGYKIASIQMAGYVAADMNKEVTEAEIAPSARWKEVKPTKDGTLSMTPDTTDDYVYMDEYVNYLVNTLGNSSSPNGIQGYCLDNEPALWTSTHARMHPEKTSCAELVEKSIIYADAVKSVDPGAEVYGGMLYGFGAYRSMNDTPDWESTYAKEYDWFISYYLDQMAKAEETYGKRLLDVMDVHYYSEAKGQCRVTTCNDHTHTDCIAARLQAPRTLNDATYIENSWIGEWYDEYIPLLLNVKKSIDTYYPGTKLALTEYNFGGGDHISGAVSLADALGIFAELEVYHAGLFAQADDLSYHFAAIDLYTNYDGNGAAFGNMLMKAETSDIENATAYAAVDQGNDTRATVVLTNKNMSQPQKASIAVTSDQSFTTAKIYGITGESTEIQLLDTINGIEGNCFDVELPALSVAQIELTTESNVAYGDVNADGTVDMVDAALLQAYLAGDPNADISMHAGDVTRDGSVNIFDLFALKRILYVPEVVPETPVDYELVKAGEWLMGDEIAGKTLTCTFHGKMDCRAGVGYGYTAADGTWHHNDETKMGTIYFDEEDKASCTFTVPESIKDVHLYVYYYAGYDADADVSIEYDKSEVSIVSITARD